MSTRRTFLRQFAGTVAGLQAAAAFPQDTPPADILTTPSGRLRGQVLEGTRIFRGIPFAAPPVGPLRFRPPQPARPWPGVLDATRFAPAAQQPGESAVPKSEDCLYLNIWAPAAQAQLSPVLVWVHGGGFTGGRASDPTFDGTRFTSAGIVCITVAYRLGVFGFLDVEPLLGPSYAGSANNGLKDIVAALTWVKANIASFGGDPARITLAGESAGAKLTDLLLGAPSAQPLFHQAISESGGAERIWPRTQALAIGQGFAAAWTAQTSQPPSAVLQADPAQLLTVQEQFQRTSPTHFPLRPSLDGTFFPALPIAAMRHRSAAGKRLLIGTNRDESAFFIGPTPAKDPTAHDLGNLTVDQFHPLEAAYAQLYPDMPAPLRRIRSLTAEEYLVPSVRVSEACAAAGAEVFAYRLDFPGEGRFAGLAYHSYDLRFVWQRLPAQAPSPAQQLAASIHQAWVAFISGKPPAAPGLPAWPPYTLKDQKTMILDATSQVLPHPDQAELALWRDYFRDPA